MEQHLKATFHLSNFRPLQLKAINLTMSGKDLFLVMPTGRGKSLCYQLPAICSNGTVRHTCRVLSFQFYALLLRTYFFYFYHLSGFTLVITPLVSLMEDQLMYLKTIDVSAVMLNASSSRVRTACHVEKDYLRIMPVCGKKIIAFCNPHFGYKL